MSVYPVRVIEPDELEAWFAAIATAFFVWPSTPRESAGQRRDLLDLSRIRAAYDGDTIVGTYRSFASELTLPGGTSVPAGAVTAVTVRPTHRRRGILSAMLAADARAGIAAGEAAGVLLAAEWPIYGRFGYGPATYSADWTLRVRQARFAGSPTGTVELVEPAAGLDTVTAVRAAHRRRQPGAIRMPDYSPRIDLGLLEWAPNPPWKGHLAVHRDAAGRPDAIARYHGEEHWPEGIPDNVLVLDELLGTSDEAERELWRHLAAMDLIATIRAGHRSPAEPLPWWLEDARAARMTSVGDHLWVRVHDVVRCLTSRAYEAADTLVLEVTDELDGRAGPAHGTWRLDAGPEGAACVPTTASPDLRVPASAIGSILLGGVRLADVARRSPVVEHRPGAIDRADRLFRTAATPWCPVGF
jgi:predicted acetyltransferase